MSGTTASTRAG